MIVDADGGGADTGGPTATTGHRSPPAPVRAAGVIALLQGLALAALAAIVGIGTVVGHPQSVLFAALDALMALAGGLALGALGRALLRVDRWARTPTVVLQLLALAVAWGLAQSHVWSVFAAVFVPAVLVLLLLAAPSARAALYHGGFDEPPGQD